MLWLTHSSLNIIRVIKVDKLEWIWPQMGNKRSAWNDSELDTTVNFSVSIVELSDPDS